MPSPPPFSPTVALLTLGRVWDAAYTEMLAPFGLTTRKYGLLGHVRSSPGLSFSELARRSRITVQSAHTAIAGFSADGLVEDASARAGAASSLRVTPAGEQLLDEVAQRVAALDADFTAAHPGLAEALRVHVTQLMSPPSV